MKGWKWTLGLGAAVFLLAGFLGCIYKYHEKEIVLEFGMFTGSNWDVASASSFVMIDKAIAKFEEEHPGVRIHYYSGISKEDYSEWCARKLLEGKMPDVFMVPDTDFNLYSSLGVMKNLDELIEHDAGFNRNDFFTTALDAGKYDGHQCALPYETVPVLLFVNKSLLAKEQIEVPGEDWTWDDMYEICRKITKDVNGDGLLDQFGTYNYSWRNAVYTSGGRFYDGDQQQLPFTDSHVLDAIKYMKRLNDLNQGQSVTQEDFNKGNVAFMPLTFAEYRTYKTYPYRIKKYTRFQWDCITFPAGKEDEHHQDCAQYHGGIPGEPAVKAYIAHGPGNRGRGIHMLAQDIRGLACQHISQDTAAHACEDAQKDGKEMIFPVTGCPCGIDAGDCECAQSDGIKQVHHLLIG